MEIKLYNKHGLSSKANGILTKQISPQNIDLLSKVKDININIFIQKDFKITTRNGSSNFNKNILSETSSVIKDILKENPNTSQYHLDIEDDQNVLGKFEQIYQNKSVEFSKNESSILRQIIDGLNITNFPNFIDENDKIKFTYNFKGKYMGSKTTSNISTIFFYNDSSIVRFDAKSLEKYFQLSKHQTFKNQTKSTVYMCNIFGIRSSSLIRDFLAKNPESDCFLYDFEDGENEFQYICRFFNFQTTILTKENVDVIKEIAKDLGIDCIFNEIDDFIGQIENVSQSIDDQQSIVDRIDALFDVFFHIKEKGVDYIENYIKSLKWLENEDYVYELAAIILQVVQTDISLDDYLIDLLIKLDEDKSENNQFKTLFSFVKERTMILFNQKIQLIFPFVYKLYKKELLPKDKVEKILANSDVDDSFFVSWFLPELYELNQKLRSKKFMISNNYIIESDSNLISNDSLIKLIQFFKSNENKKN